jgi:DNA polymerase-3 subunit chi
MTEILFYHLETRPLEAMLPDLLKRSLAKGWNVVVQFGTEEKLEALDAHLWTYDDASFLAHGSKAEGHAALQPVWLTVEDDNPNGAAIRFYVDGATTDRFEGYERIVFIFDSGDMEATGRAREAWKAAKASGGEATYWRQDETGRWNKHA